jgi:hypothetical protein
MAQRLVAWEERQIGVRLTRPGGRAVSCWKMGKLADRRFWTYGHILLPTFTQETALGLVGLPSRSAR